ncbi:hypothetical protein MUN74_11075 [Agromyces endophyticus]|uniref:hypothetical protein n=1 Tax=Agromyces sp. H17E-10 TaxID=2932244 RepID=UPI001FD20C6A|nr:hypothetical protein [Agromyces sp. H17E-10]UOQ87844.1 hypothetical protein MUN74_11075 [Agromyces sp. H17E-10]
METRSARIESLGRLVEGNGVMLATDDAAIQRLNDWFLASVEADPERPGFLLPAWYSVTHDVALFLGEVMIERHPTLRWEFFVWGKTNVAYQRHVIMGFSTEDPKLRTNIDIDRLVATYGHQLVESRGSVASLGKVEIRGTTIDIDAVAASHRSTGIDSDRFVQWLSRVTERA